MEDKVPLRALLRQQRSALPIQVWQRQSRHIVERLLHYFEQCPALAVALYSPLEARREVDVSPLDEWLRSRGVRIAYPIIDNDTIGFAWVDDRKALTLRSHFAQPSPSDPRPRSGELDLIIVPALAASPSGYRLGYGAGYYDRVLPLFCPPARSICVVFESQLRDSLPLGPHDYACDGVLTEERWVHELHPVTPS